MWIYFKLKVAFKKKNICAVVLFLQAKQWWALISTAWAASSFSFRETSWSGQMRPCTLARCGSVCAWLPWQHSKSLFEIAWRKKKKRRHPLVHTQTPKRMHCCAHTHTHLKYHQVRNHQHIILTQKQGSDWFSPAMLKNLMESFHKLLCGYEKWKWLHHSVEIEMEILSWMDKR